MLCDNCGKQLQDSAKFCPYCGSPVYQEPAHSNDQPSKDSGNAEAQSSTPKVSQKSSKNNRKALWISIIAVFCAIAIAIGTVFTLLTHDAPSSESDSADNSVGGPSDGFIDTSTGDSIWNEYVPFNTSAYQNSYNMTDGTYVARNNKYIFYINSNEAVVRMDEDFENRKVVVEGKSVDLVYLSEKNLYYHDAETHFIYASDFDGNNEQQLVPLKTCWFTIVEENLYFLEGYYVWDYDNMRTDSYGEFALYRANLDGTDYKKIISDGATRISIQENNIVYFNSEENTVYAVGLDGTGKIGLYANGDEKYIYRYKVYKNKLYYSIYNTQDENISGLYSIDLTTRNEEKIISTIPGEFTFWNDSIIYVADSNSSNAATHICQLDGSHDEILLEDSIRDPLVMGDYMYCHISPSTISAYNLKTNESDAFEVKRYTDMAFTDNHIFYIDSQDNNIYRCDHDGENTVKLTNAYCTALYTYAGKLYYYGYANGYNPDNRETPSGIFPSGFFQLDANGEGCVAIELDGDEDTIFSGDYIYFPSIYDSHIYRTRLDNVDTEETNKPFIRASKNNDFETPFFVVDNWLYLCMLKNDTETLSRVSLDGSNIQTIVNKYPYDIQLYNNKIYYLSRDNNDNWQLRRVNLDGTNDILMLQADISEYYIVNDILYYIDNTYKRVFSVNLDGTKKSQLSEDACHNFKVFDGKIYYTNLYDHGYIYSMDLDGSNCKVVIGDNDKYAEKTNYTTTGIDDAKPAKEKNKDVSFEPSDTMNFEDSEFEAFLCEMFEKQPGTITGADLLSVQYFGYYEGAPTSISTLMNRGQYRWLYENCVLFNTSPYPGGNDVGVILCGDASGDALAYRESCTVLTVRSNEWMAEHVMPYLYYFKNMKHVAFCYCWVSDNLCLPIGVDWDGTGPHSRYLHDPYDPLYE